MSAPALIRKEDMRRAADVAKETGCRIEIRVGDAIFIVDPSAPAVKESPIDYSRPSL